MMSQFSRRTLIGNTAAAGGLTAFSLGVRGAQASKSLDFSNAEEGLRAYAKLLGNTKAATVHYWYSGTIYGVLPGEDSQPVMGFAGLAKNIWWPTDEGNFGQRIFDVGYFADLETGEPIDEFVNPFTGKTNHPVHYRSGPSQFTRAYENRNWQVSGDDVWLEESLAFKMPNWLEPAEWPLASSGETLRFRYTNTYRGKVSDLENPSITSAPSLLGWNAITDWYPFMLMGQQPGFLNWISQGRKINDFSEVSSQTMRYLEAHLPDYLYSDEPWTEPANNYVQYMEQRQPMRNE
ncbi:MAG: DUF1838 domain-containing protein [Alphaproteobacteria bacterium]|nr:DUF1838 domain-containing protein [Alphaproteobacteria bacterium]